MSSGVRPGIFRCVNEFDAMGRALELAWRGWGRVAPNPMVGAVILRDGELLAEAYHAEYGLGHAEPVALAAAGEATRGSTLLVTLEPCAHQGKQPPCTEAILAAGIGRVVSAMADPNPAAAGGAEWLRQRGVTVEIGLRAEQAAEQNAAFLHRFSGKERPYVGLKLATTLDGRIADQGGRSRWISGPEAREYVHWLRAGFDAIGVGGYTARTDDSSLTVRGSLEPRVPPKRVIFDRLGELPSGLRLVRTARTLPTYLIASPQASPSRLATLDAAGVQVRQSATLAGGLAHLWREGIHSMIVEGGGRLAGALLAEDLVDRYYWIQSPVWLGETGVPAIAGLPGRNLVEAERWRVVERRALGEDTLLVADRAPCLPGS